MNLKSIYLLDLFISSVFNSRKWEIVKDEPSTIRINLSNIKFNVGQSIIYKPKLCKNRL